MIVRLFVFIFLLFLCFSSFIVQNARAAECTLPNIPASITPTKGSVIDEFTFQLNSNQMSNEDMEKYEGVDLYVWVEDGGFHERVSPIAYKIEDGGFSFRLENDIDETETFSLHISHTSLNTNNINSNEFCEANPLSIQLTIDDSPSDSPLELEMGSICSSDKIRRGIETCPEGSTCELYNSKEYCTCDVDNDICPVGKKCRDVGGYAVCVDEEDVNNRGSDLLPTLAAPPPSCDEGRVCDTALGAIDVSSYSSIVSTLFKYILFIAGAVMLFQFTYAGYTIMTSRGDPEKVSEARERIVAAIMGLLFIVFSVIILEIIGVDILRIPGFGK